MVRLIAETFFLHELPLKLFKFGDDLLSSLVSTLRVGSGDNALVGDGEGVPRASRRDILGSDVLGVVGDQLALPVVFDGAEDAEVLLSPVSNLRVNSATVQTQVELDASSLSALF